MNKLQQLENEIETLRNEMHKLIKSEKNTTSKHIVTISQELDKVLNKYNKIKSSDF